MKNWEIFGKWKMENGKWKIDGLIKILLENRGLKTKKERDDFLNPKHSDVTIKSVGINETQLKKALTRIKKAIKNQEQIIIFGDYDVDGITSTAILWETLHKIQAKVMPYIPHRVEEGYGLSELGITNIKNKYPDTKLIITVDNGIVAQEAVDFANKQGIDVIITDHHVVGETLPKANAIVHTTKLCGAGVAYLLAQELKVKNKKLNVDDDNHLELAMLGTIADMVPLTGANRTIVKFGLEKLGETKRVGLLELFKIAGLSRQELELNKKIFTPYEVAYIIAPRLNATGRIESAMDSLRLLCTNDKERAKLLAEKLELINKERQWVLKEAAEHAVNAIQNSKLKTQNLLFVAHETYQQGVIGLVAGKLVEKFYRPSIVISLGEKQSKASARSIAGFNMIEFLRLHTKHFVNVGGHPMAAGFTVATENLATIQKLLEQAADKLLTEELLQRGLKIDCELPLSVIDNNLYDQLQILSPFGTGNPEPTFASYNVEVVDLRVLGKDKNHLRLLLKQDESQKVEAIAFGALEFIEKIKIGDKIDIAYTIDNNVWNGNTKLQLKIKDIKVKETVN